LLTQIWRGDSERKKNFKKEKEEKKNTFYREQKTNCVSTVYQSY
jgi:hypothetical protein